MALLTTIGQRLVAARKRKGLRAREVAKGIGVHPKTVSRWENDRQAPEGAPLEKLAALLDVTDRWILRGEVQKVATPAPKPAVDALSAAFAVSVDYARDILDIAVRENQRVAVLIMQARDELTPGRGPVTQEEQRDEAGKRAKQRTRPSPQSGEGGPHPG